VKILDTKPMMAKSAISDAPMPVVLNLRLVAVADRPFRGCDKVPPSTDRTARKAKRTKERRDPYVPPEYLDRA
jgi:hypothetical protein